MLSLVVRTLTSRSSNPISGDVFQRYFLYCLVYEEALKWIDLVQGLLTTYSMVYICSKYDSTYMHVR